MTDKEKIQKLEYEIQLIYKDIEHIKDKIKEEEKGGDKMEKFMSTIIPLLMQNKT